MVYSTRRRELGGFGARDSEQPPRICLKRLLPLNYHLEGAIRHT